MKVGDKVKLSERGLQHLYHYRRPDLMERAKHVRGEVRKINREIVTIQRLDTPSHYRSQYHITFLELAE